MGKHNKWTLEDTNFLKEHYTETNSWIAEQLNRGKRTIVYHRARLQLPRPHGYRAKYKERTNIEKFKLGWVIGLFATDGCATTNRKTRSPVERISLSLSATDSATVHNFFNIVLEDFDENDISEKIGVNSYSSNAKASYICTAPNFLNSVRKYLSFDKKTYDMELTASFFTENEQFKLGFLRGVIDGDGHVSISGKSISITSASLAFLEGLQREFNGKISKRKSGNYWDLRFRTQEIEQLHKRGLLSNIDTPMHRKTQRLMEARYA